MHVKWDPTRIALTPRQATAALRDAKPSIVLSSGEHGEALSMNSFMPQAGEEKIVAQELVKVLKSRAALTNPPCCSRLSSSTR
jgi:hypothetical protein